MPPIDRQATFSGTRDVAAALAIDDARLEAYLQRAAAGLRRPADACSQFKGGQSNPTYLLETPARRYVLRRKPPGKLLPSAHAVDREFRVISALHAQGFPVAAPHLLLRRRRAWSARRSTSWTTSRAACSGNRTCRASTPAERAAVYDAMNATLARLHALRSGGASAWRFRPRRELRGAPGRALVEAVPRLGDRRRIDEMEQLIEWLPAHLPPPAPVRIVHGDYRLDNMHPGAVGSRRSWRCSTGNSRRWATRSPTSPIT